MLAVLALALLGQQLGPCGVDGPIYCGGQSYAFFEFAPTSGVGMGAACACAAVTGAKGEVMTFTASSSGTCLKHGTSLGIANGDMTTCTSTQPRIMPGGDGTGSLGILEEEARTNTLLRSQELENATWIAQVFGGGFAPVITANAATAPDGTVTADRVQIQAIAAGAYALWTQSLAAAAYSGSIFFKGNGTSGTITFEMASPVSCVTCSYNPTTWTRCVNLNSAGGLTAFYIGLDTFNCGAGSPSAAQDVFAWGGDAEVGAGVTSYIATAGAAVTRGADVAPYFAYTGPALTNGSIAGTLLCTDVFCGSAGEHAIVSAQINGTYDRLILFGSPSVTFTLYSVAGSAAIPGQSILPNVETRGVGYWVDTAGNAIWGANTGSGVLTSTGAINRILIGGYNTTAAPAGGVVKKVCVDPNPSRCR